VNKGQSNSAKGDVMTQGIIKSRVISHVKSMLCRGCHLGFDWIWNSAIRSTDPENRTLEQNLMLIGWPFAEIWSFEIRHIMRDVFGTQCVWGRGGHRGSSMVPFKKSDGFL